MAQTGGRTDTQATSQRATNDKTTKATVAPGRSSGAATTPAGGATSGAMATLSAWRGRASALLAPRAAAGTTAAAAKSATPATGAKGQTTAGTATTPQRPSTGKVMLGMLAFVAGAELLLFVVQFIDLRFFKGYLELHTVASHNTPLLGGLSWFLLILMVLTLGLWIALNRLGIIQPMTPRPTAASMAAARTAGKTGTATTTAAAGGRNRAARRLAEANAATSVKGGAKGVAKGGTGVAKGGTGKSAAVSASNNSGRLSGTNDATYQRVKAAQRSAKRRSAKH